MKTTTVTTTLVYDDLGRPKEAAEAGLRKTTTEYDDENRTIRTRSDLDGFDDGKLAGVTHFDELGRARLARTTDGTIIAATTETTGIKVQTRQLFSGNNRYQLASNPYRASTSSGASGEETMGWTRTKFDPNGRAIEFETFDGETLPSPWGTNTTSTGKVTTVYNADQTTITDQAGKVRRSTVDGLGRLIQVDEDPSGLNYTTTYDYDVVDNLTDVLQSGQPRTFVYNSLSRLTSATNPESGTTSYTYDNNGNLLRKVDARNVATCFATGSCSAAALGTSSYDELNRPVFQQYSDPTPDVRFCYDGQVYNATTDVCGTPATTIPFADGRLTGSGSTVSATNFTVYDALGRVTASEQITPDPQGVNRTYAFTYQYKRDDSLQQQINPAGRVLTYNYDGAGRISNAAGQIGAEPVKNYTSSYAYTPHGAARLFTYSNGLEEQSCFNSRLQPVGIRLGQGEDIDCDAAVDLLSLGFSYGTTSNNGNVVSQTLDAPGLPASLTQTYGYDGVNRLSSVVEGGWSRNYGYDAFGNRWLSGAVGHTLPNSTPTAETDFSSSTNRLLKNAAAYDNAGNLLGESLLGTMAYDAENHQISFTDPLTSAVTTYAYDGNRNRVKKVTSTSTTLYVYDAFGNLAAEYADVAPSAAPGTHYRTTDHLGSTRLVTDAAGGVVSRRDFFPFGEEIPGSATFGNRQLVTDGQSDTTYNDPSGYRQQFTGQERDEESEFDYFGARYFGSALGRFTSPDAPFLDQTPADPQSWNLYPYVRNNPLTYIDPTGQAIQLTGSTEEERRKELEAVQASLVNSEVSKNLYINPELDKDGKQTGRFFVGIRGDTAAFGDAGSLEAGLAEVIGSEKIVQFGLGTEITFKQSFLENLIGNATKDVARDFGGAVTQRSDGTLSGHIQTVVDPNGIRGLNEAPTPTLGEAVAHELIGHALGFIRSPTIHGARTNRRAVEAENEARRRGGPQRGRRTKHLGGFPK